MPHRHARGEVNAWRVFIGLVGYDDDTLNAFGSELARQDGYGQPAIYRLTTRHRHGVVEQQLVGNIDLGRHSGADRQNPRMGVSAVT